MNKAKDLGTYHLRVEFEDGRGYYHQWNTGGRFTHGRDGISPLTADYMTPTWEDEEDLFSSMLYIYTEGNFSCDCNRRLFLADAAQVERDDENDECGEEIKLKKLTAIRPDRTEYVLFTNENQSQ